MKMKKVTAVVMSMILLAMMIVPAYAADERDYAITNPYDGVNFETYNQYKADLHCHTNASDGTNTLKEMVERHYELGYDILAVSDHGTTSYSWTEPNYVPAIKTFCMVKRGVADFDVLDKNGGKAANGNTYALTYSDGNDYYSQTDALGETGKTMMRVPFAIENNPTSFNNAHVNSFFVDYGNGILGGTSDYETPIKNVDKLGGVSVINHPGEYTSAKEEVYTADAYDKSNMKYSYDISKFENLLMNYDSCIGIDINSKGDSRTRFDRKLWDTMLTDLTPTGRNVFAIASSDAHNLGIVNSGYVLALMENNTSANLQKCLANGEFFAASRYIGNVDELNAYADALIISGNKTASYVGNQMKDTAKKIESEIAENGKQSTIYNFDEDAANAVISDVAVNDKEDTITVSGSDILYVRWIADGKVVAEGNTVDLDNCDINGSYIRAEVIGKGGITYTQPFVLDYEGESESTYSSDGFKDLGGIATSICDTLIKFIGSLSGFFDAILFLFGINV